MAHPKVKVGQIWVGRISGVRWRITEVKDRHCSGEALGKDGNVVRRAGFGNLNDRGTPDGWGDDWKLESSPLPSSTPLTVVRGKTDTSDGAKELHFFQASAHPDVCPKCAAPRPCNYHG